MYYRNAQAAVVVYDVTKASSLEKAKTWVKELQRQANPNIVIALAGNKIDLVTPSASSSTPESEDEADDATATPGETGTSGEPESLRQVPRDEAEAYAQEAGLLFFETSAKTGEGVVEIFTEIGKWHRMARSVVATNELWLTAACPSFSSSYSQEDPHRPDSGVDSRRPAPRCRVWSCCAGGRREPGGEQHEGQGCVQLLSVYPILTLFRSSIPDSPPDPVTSIMPFLQYLLPPPLFPYPVLIYMAFFPVHVFAVVLERYWTDISYC